MKYSPEELLEKYPQVFDVDWEHERLFIHYPDGHVRLNERNISILDGVTVGHRFYSTYTRTDCVVTEMSGNGSELWVEIVP